MLESFNKNSLNKKIDHLIILYNQKDFSEVIKKTKILIQEYRDSEQLFNIMGITLLSLKEYGKALYYFKKGISINNQPMPRNNRYLVQFILFFIGLNQLRILFTFYHKEIIDN